MKYIRRFFRHIREGFVGVKRHFGMAFSASSAVTITLLLVGVFAVFAINMAYLTKEIEQSISLVALIDYEVTDSGKITSMKNVSIMSFSVTRKKNWISIFRNMARTNQLWRSSRRTIAVKIIRSMILSSSMQSMVRIWKISRIPLRRCQVSLLSRMAEAIPTYL